MKFSPLVLLFILFVAAGCNREIPDDTYFSTMPEWHTGIDFANNLDYKNPDFNIYKYRNFYNGGGVAMGDINQDGLIDIYMTANQLPNRLYLNKGDFKFEDVTEKVGVAGTGAWSTGVSIADVNGDGLLDIYVCNSGDVKGDNKQNELFINQGIDENGMPSFKDEAQAYGLADKGYSTHAAFFDYDKDGDLDCYLLNNSYQAIGSFNLRKNERPKRDAVGGDKLYRNDGGKFTDVSEEAGIYGSVIGFGLGVTVGDINFDGWQDIFVSNDFFERDYVYINNQDGTFTEELEKEIKSISAASMGADMADINNDGLPEIFVTEMLPEPDERVKTVTTFENWDNYQYKIENDYYHQFTRNMLHLHNGVSPAFGGKGRVTFSEVGRLAGVHATDWSWGALMADYNNDGNKDLFIANGIFQDLTNQDYLNFLADDENKIAMITKDGVDYGRLIDAIPSVKIPNYMYVNKGNLAFENKAIDWGLAEPSHSNGSAYADLDNDGDLDLVVNNVNMPAFIYRNNAEKFDGGNYLKINLLGAGKNTQAIGTKVTIKQGEQLFYLEQMPIRGFQSTVDPRLNFGLGGIEKVDSIIVEWYDGKLTILTNVSVNQTLELKQTEGKIGTWFRRFTPKQTLFQNVTPTYPMEYRHVENKFADFDRYRLIYHMRSTEGPKLAKADVNGDGLEDLYLGGAKDQAGKLLIQLPNGGFRATSSAVFELDKGSEDLGSLFFDADDDGDLDLYVTSGGNEFSSSALPLYDRLYFNDGKGNFKKSAQRLPTKKLMATSCVVNADIDGDGDQDLFVGARLMPFTYGVPVDGYILENDGKGNFTDITEKIAPELKGIGMITDATWQDIDGDKDLDLILVGEWLPLTIFKNQGGKLVNSTAAAGLDKSNGWWNTIKAADLDKDGDIDFVVGNHGLNSRFKTSENQPTCVYVNDFDKNGTAEQIICVPNGDNAYPMVLRHDLVMQIPSLKKKYLKYERYKRQTIDSIFTKEQLETAFIYSAFTFETAVFLNNGDGTFTMKQLPKEAQFAPIYAIAVHDFDRDGHLDLTLGGNLYAAKPQVGRYDADYGLFLKGNGKGDFTPIRSGQSGFFVDGEIRDLTVIKVRGKEVLLTLRNNDTPQIFEFQEGLIK